jgi:hypothetical protein
MVNGLPIRPWILRRQSTSTRLVLALCVLACLHAPQAVGQWVAEPTVDPFQQRGVRASAYQEGPTADVDPLPPLNRDPRAERYPRVAAALPDTYPPGPAATPPTFATPAYPSSPPVMPGAAYPSAPYQQLPPQQFPPPGAALPPAYGDSFPHQPQVLVPADPGKAAFGSRILDHLEGNVVVRGFYRNDQRVVWSGMEETFGAEADLTPRLRYRCGDFEFVVDSQFWINQPYEQNPLENTAERRSYAADFKVAPFAVGQLALVTNYGDWTFKIGKFVTPFGRAYYPVYTNPYLTTNSGMDEPFIRTEVIQDRETGILAHYKSGYFAGDIALANGGDNLDTNSSKALVARLGLESDSWAIGASAKKMDGDGSEAIKEFGTYYGVDAMLRSGPFRLSAECVYDEYGFGRPGYDPMDIYWIKSIYYRDVSSGQQGVPCTGVGYYLDLNYSDGRWDATLDYGEFHPLFTGTAPDQRIQRRGLIKLAYRWAQPLQSYTVVILENDGYPAQDNQSRSGVAFLQGFQFTF